MVRWHTSKTFNFLILKEAQFQLNIEKRLNFKTLIQAELSPYNAERMSLKLSFDQDALITVSHSVNLASNSFQQVYIYVYCGSNFIEFLL